jgi:hypothetical protein
MIQKIVFKSLSRTKIKSSNFKGGNAGSCGQVESWSCGHIESLNSRFQDEMEFISIQLTGKGRFGQAKMMSSAVTHEEILKAKDMGT